MDPYIHSRSHLLKNKANLHTPEALAAHEARMVFKRLIFLYSRPVTGTFDLAHLLAIHHALFQDVYPWAGRVRSCDLSLGLVSFCPAQWLESSLTALFGELARENWLRERSAEKFAHGAAYYLAELNAIHPGSSWGFSVRSRTALHSGTKAGPTPPSPARFLFLYLRGVGAGGALAPSR